MALTIEATQEGPPVCVGSIGVVGILSCWNYPGHVRELTGADVGQHVRGVEIDIILPLRSGALW